MTPPRFFFIVGCPRSGTTLLRFMLDAHPEIAVTPETHFAERYVKDDRRENGNSLDQSQTPTRSEVDAFCRSDAFTQMAIDETSFRDQLSRSSNEPKAWRLLGLAMEMFGGLQKASLVGEKTPSHTLHLDALAEAFHEARFLVLKRDSRAVAASWLRTSWSHNTAAEIAEIWRRYDRAIQEARSRFSERMLEIRFESLVSDSENELTSICRFLGTSFDPGMLAYPERGEEVLSPEERAEHALILEEPKSSRINAWRTELDRRDLCQVEVICAASIVRDGGRCETSLIERVPSALGVMPAILRKRAKRTLRGLLRRNRRHGLSSKENPESTTVKY